VKIPKLGLAGQVLTGITVLFLLITIATSLVSAWNLDRQLTREFETKGTAIANSIANSSIELLLARDGSSLQAMIDGFLDISGVGYVFVLDSDDQIVVHTFAPAIPDQLIERASVHDNSAGTAVATLDIAGMGTYVDVAAPILAGVAGTVHVGMDRRFIDAEVRSAVLLQGLIVLGIFAVSMALAYVHIVRVAQPLVVLTEHANRVASPEHLRRMASASEDVTADPQVTPIASWAADEVGALAAAFQNMELELQRYIGNLRRAQQELEEYNRTLEHKVNQRTSELVFKNAELESTLDKLKQAQEQIVTQEKLASLGALTAGIAHEIKNPLNFINNFAQLSAELATELAESVGKAALPEDTAADINDVVEMLKMNVEKINEHGKRADSIVRNMLTHSRKTKGERTDVDVNALLSEYVGLAYHGMRGQDQSFNAKIETRLDPAVTTISAIPQDLSRAFLNILTNACYALRDKTKTAGDGYAPVLTVSTKLAGDDVEIRIRDNGTGIPDEVKAKIFEPFFTTKPAGQGTGLGLSMTFDILVQAHRGKVDVDTKTGEYAEFIIRLPRTEPAGTPA
jgi:signal transduction histidine kinase/HAMP domain-containing protein